MRISDLSSDVCSSDLEVLRVAQPFRPQPVSAVKADVGEGPDRAVMLADDQHRFLADFGADIVARLLDVVRTAADQPDLRPDPLPLQLHERFAGLSFGGDDVVDKPRVFRLPGCPAVRPILRIYPAPLNLALYVGHGRFSSTPAPTKNGG